MCPIKKLHGKLLLELHHDQWKAGARHVTLFDFDKATTNCIVVSRPGYGYNSVRAGGDFIIHYGCGKGNTSHKVL